MFIFDQPPAIIAPAPKKLILPGDPCFIPPDEAAGIAFVQKKKGGYLYYRFGVTAGNNGTWCGVGEIQFRLVASGADILPTMTGNPTSGVSIVGSAAADGTSFDWKAGDDSAASFYLTSAANIPFTITVTLASAAVVKEYTVQAINGGGSEIYMLKDWTLKASKTGLWAGEEVTISTVTNQTAWSAGQTRTFTSSL